MATKFDKVVNREVCRVTTKGTQTFSFLDGDATEAKSNYLLAIAEKVRIIYCESKYIPYFTDDRSIFVFLNTLASTYHPHRPIQG
jgi:DNA mismatch repair ATPase MutS